MTDCDQRRMQVDRLDRLLALAGPEDGAELLDRLAEDLARVVAALVAAGAAGDLAAVRAETHILIAVAGAVGGMGLAGDARRMNEAAHGSGDPDPCLMQAIVRDLATLQALVAARARR